MCLYGQNDHILREPEGLDALYERKRSMAFFNVGDANLSERWIYGKEKDHAG